MLEPHDTACQRFLTPDRLPFLPCSWSGPPEGLTFQRAIRALETYGHHAELLLAGELQKAALLTTHTFPQQIDPFTSKPDGGDCYGPMLLAFLELTALTTGIVVRPEAAEVHFSAVAVVGTAVPPAFSFEQRLGATVFHVDGLGNGTFVGSRNGALIFSCDGSTRIVAGVDGVVTRVIGSSAAPALVQLRLPGSVAPLALQVPPNTEWAINGASPPQLVRQVPFTPPYF